MIAPVGFLALVIVYFEKCHLSALIALAVLVSVSFVKVYREDLKNGAVDFELDRK